MFEGIAVRHHADPRRSTAKADPRPRRRTRMRGLVVSAIALGLATGLIAPAAEAATAPRPRLVVMLVVDQMREDYIDRYSQQWTAGLRRLIEQGAWFRGAAYPYFSTVTCAGHATISTGAFPSSHGMVLNGWWDRKAGAMTTCTDDADAKLVSYGEPVAGGHSPRRLRVPTFTDELRQQTTPAPKIVSLSLKPRSAITLAGRRAEAVVWAEGATFVTSTFYTNERVPVIERFLASSPLSAEERTWTRRLPDSAYLFTDAAAGERPPDRWTSSFPHALGTGAVDAAFKESWTVTPFTDDYLGRMAHAAVDGFGLGKGPGTDYLGVSFSALDMVGHAFGPKSHEVQDTLVRVDATIGALLEHLDRAVGKEHYVVGFSADHGVAPIPEQAAADGFDAGRIVLEPMGQRVEEALRPAGFEKPVAKANYTDFYFAPGVYPKLTATPALLQRIIDALMGTPGVSRVLRGDELSRGASPQDPLARAAALGYDAERSGDLIVIPKPYWIFVNAGSANPPGPGTSHGTAYAYDKRVPVILMGAGIQPGQHLDPVTPADIAPTLAFLCGITLGRADGHVLEKALAPPVPVPSPAPAARRPSPKPTF
jgi:predicted AlkP superfamily pyrophosphatase or phosphodiesterase